MTSAKDVKIEKGFRMVWRPLAAGTRDTIFDGWSGAPSLRSRDPSGVREPACGAAGRVSEVEGAAYEKTLRWKHPGWEQVGIGGSGRRWRGKAQHKHL